jgi:hypothetical protein
VQPFAAARVGALGHDPQHVLGRQALQRDPVAVERVRLTGSPFRVISRTAGAVRLMKVDEPGAPQPNLITLTEPNVESPSTRSSSTSYEVTWMSAERAMASSRVRFDVTGWSLLVRRALGGGP